METMRGNGQVLVHVPIQVLHPNPKDHDLLCGVTYYGLPRTVLALTSS